MHATVAQRKKLLVDWVPAGDLEDTTAKEVNNLPSPILITLISLYFPSVLDKKMFMLAESWCLQGCMENFEGLHSLGFNGLGFVGCNCHLSTNHLTGLPLQGADGVLVPGGFGDRGVQGKILAAKYARENRIPYLGICLGMQTAVIEFARSVLGLRDANSTEFDNNTKNPCVIFMPEVYIYVFLSSTLQWENVHLLRHLSDINTMLAGLKDTYGRHHAPWIKKNIFPGHGLQIS